MLMAASSSSSDNDTESSLLDKEVACEEKNAAPDDKAKIAFIWLAFIQFYYGHSVDYNFVCEAETAEAEEAQQFFANDGTLQLLEPGTPEALVLTYW
eukprot:gene6590-7334_t